MEIAIVGYGKMGKAIERVAIDRGHTVIARINSTGNVNELPASTEIAIEFTRPESAVSNLKSLIALQIPVVCGTTGWNEDLNKIKELVQKSNVGLVHASNFSLGVNLFFELNNKLAALMDGHSNYKVSMTEIHHTQKKDAPSGTAISLFEGLSAVNTSSGWRLSENNKTSGVPINAIRKDDVKGTHTVRYDSQIDSIEITHEAHSRDGFALGAVIAAEWVLNKRGTFTMKDVLGL